MSKYALIERERRFLLGGPPPGLHRAESVTEIGDLYFDGTRLRLRRATTWRGSTGETVLKLTQKIPVGPGSASLTTLYLDDAEFDLLARLPAHRLEKVRHRLPPLGVDEFKGPLAGLWMCEVEFPDPGDCDRFLMPGFAVAEVTADRRFTGGCLASSSRREFRAAVESYGVRIS